MKWNWQQRTWPDFTYDSTKLQSLENRFLQLAGEFNGIHRFLDSEDRSSLVVDLISDEAVKTSEIEGEILRRDSVRSSLMRGFGLASDQKNISPAERGISEMMLDSYRCFAGKLSHKSLCHWHNMIMSGRHDVHDGGRYRTHTDPMRIVSGVMHSPRVHFEAPPSKSVKKEMDRFIVWFNSTAPGTTAQLPALTRAGIAHLYFVSIHPFEDGNGRIGRALAEKVLSQQMGHPSLIALSQTIEKRRKQYYDRLELSNKGTEITHWLLYFAQTILEAQNNSLNKIDFVLRKTRFLDSFRDSLNPRQKKAVLRMLQEGPDGFKGGLSADKYIKITKSSRATATRDLQDLVQQGALSRAGALKSTRYFLRLK